jgi:transposase-like protein
MEEFPHDLDEFELLFATEQSCRDYLVKLRWPEGFVCPRCRSTEAWSVRTILLECTRCHYQVSVTAGTIFQDTRKPLRQWFRAIWYVTSQKNGASALGMQRILGIKSYTTAWQWLHKIRRAMVRPGRDRLSGAVEVDETYLGGHEEGVGGRELEKKALIVIAAQIDGQGTGRIRMKRIPDASAATLTAFIQEAVEPSSVIHTDGWEGYSGLKDIGYRHKEKILRGNRKKAHELMPRVHRIASLLKRWILGTHQGAVSNAHLDYYLDEFVFRFNRRTSQYRGKLFYRLLQQAVHTAPAPYALLNKRIRSSARERRPGHG